MSDGSMRDDGKGRGRAVRVLALGLMVLSVSACSARQTYQGYSFDNKKLSEIKPGVQDQSQVEAILGSPSTRATFARANDTWYYISKHTSVIAFFPPVVKNQRVVAIDFGPNGKVKDLRDYTLKDARNIEPLTQTTPSTGQHLTFFQQLFGSVGRFNSVGPTSPGQIVPTMP